MCDVNYLSAITSHCLLIPSFQTERQRDIQQFPFRGFRQQAGAEPGGSVPDVAAPHAANQTRQPGHLRQDTRGRHCWGVASEGEPFYFCSSL